MKIEYEFVTGTVEVEVPDDWETVMVELTRQEYNNNHAETRRHCSLAAYNLDDNLLPSDTDVEREILAAEDQRRLHNAESFPVYRIEGAISGSGSITITTNGAAMRIANATLSAGEILVVDTDKMTAWVEGSSGITLRNALPYLEELNFPTLAVGGNTVQVAVSGAALNGIQIQARSRWR